MRRMGKTMAGIAAFLIMAGGMLAIAGWAMGADTSYEYERGGYTHYVSPFNMGRRWAENATDMVVESGTELEPFQRVEVDVSLGDVYFQASDSYAVSLVWSSEKNKLSYEVKDGTLRVWSETQPSIGHVDQEATAYIYFPEDAGFESVNVKSNLGNVEMYGFTAKTLTAESNLGKIQIDSVTADTANLYLSLGDLDVDNITVGGKTTVTNNLGDVSLDGTFHGLDVTCDMGQAVIYTNLPQSEYTYDLNTSMGSISLDGDTVKGSSTSGGTGTHTIKVRASMGDVDLCFQ